MAINYVSMVDGQVEERWYLDLGMYRKYVNGQLATQRNFDATDTAWKNVIQAIDALDTADPLTKLRNALNTNKAYLDKVNGGTAVTADHLAQVSALTRQLTVTMLRTLLEIH